MADKRQKTNKEKALNGNPGRRALPEPVKPPPGVPQMPGNLPARAVEEWQLIVPILDKMGTLSILDRAVIADFCLVVARLEECESAITRDGLLIPGERGLVKHPASTIIRDYRAKFHKGCELLGLAPGPRGRMNMPDTDEDDDPKGLLD